MSKLAISVIAMAAAAFSVPAMADTNLIQNGTFAAGLSDWTEVNSCCYFTDSNGFHEGAVGTTGMLSQTFADTAGAALTVAFDFASNAGFQYVSFDGVAVPGSYVAAPTPYLTYSFALGTGTGIDTITFDGQNDPSYNTLTNVVVTQAVPEPATWAMMLTGLGLAGYAMRKRNVRTTFAYA